jgi:hypothetical protein
MLREQIRRSQGASSIDNPRALTAVSLPEAVCNNHGFPIHPVLTHEDGTTAEQGDSHMRKLRLVLLTALAALSLGAIAVSAAQATEGPFWKVEGGRLAKGEKHPISATVTPTSKFTLVAGTFTLEATELELEGGNLLGSNAANAGSSEETIVFKNVTLKGDGEGCEVYSEKVAGTPEPKVIRTVPVSNTLDYANELRTGIILIFFKPITGSVFVNLKFKGANCKPFNNGAPTAVEGSIAGEAWSAVKPVEVGAEPAAAVSGEINFPVTLIKKDFIEEEGLLKEVKPSLKAFGKAVTTFTGNVTVKLTGAEKEKWCISTNTPGGKC